MTKLDPIDAIVLSHMQVAPLLNARRSGATAATTSSDLGLTTLTVDLIDAGVRFPGGDLLTWDAADEIVDDENKCFTLTDGAINPISFYSERTNWLRTLFPTQHAPTMLVSGISMHRIKGIDPYADTLRKIKTIAPITGRVLDTATGLGYTAIEAAKTASEVITIELDPAGLEVARRNPWSRALFTNDRIRQIVGDTYEEIEQFPDSHFARIIHDPPMFSLAGELYSGVFYRQLFRVLTRNGRLFHYIGDLESTSGRSIVPGVLRRLKEAGFQRIVRHQQAFGVVALK